MKIAITPRFYEGKGEQLISIEKKYYPFFQRFGHNINLIPFMGLNPDEYLNELKPDAIVFAGGYRLYSDEIRIFEEKVLETSLQRKLPILAICCGMWTVNCYFNGTLKFNKDHQAFDGEKINVTKMMHYVEAKELVEKKNYKVNTFHSKVIDKLGSDLKTFLISDDGEIEGIYNLEKKIIGVQFHMENKGVDEKLTQQIMKIFSSF